MKIISWNVNGLRSVYQKGFPAWLDKSGADIVCVQEVKAQASTVPQDLFSGSKYSFIANYAERPGYSGVGIYVKEKPKKIDTKLGHLRFDNEGRMVRLDYPDFTFIGLYIPNGSRDKRDMGYKLEVYRHLFEYLKSIKKKNVILAGDFNIAHEEIDLARPKENKNNTMFTPEERKQIDTLESLGFVDSFRLLHKEGSHYSWWPYFANARERNRSLPHDMFQPALRGITPEREARRGGSSISYDSKEQRSDPALEPRPRGIDSASAIPASFPPRRIASDTSSSSFLGLADAASIAGGTYREGGSGWRIDYVFVSKALAPKLKNAFILPSVTGSDHCPVGIEI